MRGTPASRSERRRQCVRRIRESSGFRPESESSGTAYSPPFRIDPTIPPNSARLLNSGQVTGAYLLALASAHGGKLATFDRQLVVDAVVNGSKALHLID